MVEWVWRGSCFLLKVILYQNEKEKPMYFEEGFGVLCVALTFIPFYSTKGTFYPVDRPILFIPWKITSSLFAPIFFTLAVNYGLIIFQLWWFSICYACRKVWCYWLHHKLSHTSLLYALFDCLVSSLYLCYPISWEYVSLFCSASC